MRTIIRQTATGSVSLTATNPMTGEVETQEFWVPSRGGYVRSGDNQVCEYLASTGNTLSVRDPAHLLPLIRAEWRRARETEQRAAARW